MKQFFNKYIIRFLCCLMTMICSLNAMQDLGFGAEIKQAKKIRRAIKSIAEYADKAVLATKHAHKLRLNLELTIFHTREKTERYEKLVEKNLMKLPEPYQSELREIWQTRFLDNKECEDSAAFLTALKHSRKALNASLNAYGIRALYLNIASIFGPNNVSLRIIEDDNFEEEMNVNRMMERLMHDD